MGALTTLNQLAVSPLVYLAMEKSPVLSAFIGTGSLAVGGLLSFALPKNMGMQNVKENSESPVVPKTHWALRPLAVFRTAISAMKTLLKKNVQLGLLLISLILTTIGHLESSFDLQYATKRYGWTWSKVSSCVPSLYLPTDIAAGWTRTVTYIYYESDSNGSCGAFCNLFTS